MRRFVMGALVLVTSAVSATHADALVFSVGRDGTYDTVQEALTAAATFPFLPWFPPYHEVRIQEGTYTEHLRAPNPCCGGRTIKVSGGWNAAFTGQLIAPSRTVVSAGWVGRAIDVPWLTSGSLTIENLTISDGRVRSGGAYGPGEGAGLRAVVDAPAQLHLRWLIVRSNLIRADLGGETQASGGGALILGGGGLVIDQTRFEDNGITAAAGSRMAGRGGGLYLEVFGGNATITNTTFLRNVCSGDTAYGGGLYAHAERVTGTALRLEGSSFIGNMVSPAGYGAGMHLLALRGDGSPNVVVRRTRFLSQITGNFQATVHTGTNARVDVSDTLVAKGRAGLRGYAGSGGGTVRFTNLTVAHNSSRGFDGLSAGGRLSLHNTIAFANSGGDVLLAGDSVTSGFNLVDIDPLFIDPEEDFFGLGSASAAIDAGTNVPPGGLGPLDLARQPRVYNGAVDIGAFEWRP